MQVKVAVGNEVKQLVARVLTPYRPRLARSVEAHLKEKYITPSMSEGYYAMEAKSARDDPRMREDVRATLGALVDQRLLDQLAAAPERVLARAMVVLNEKLISKASYDAVDGAGGKKLYNMNISLTDEGRRRLWKYSREHDDPDRHRLMLTCNGIAIAAPRLGYALGQSELTITQMADESLVKEAVDAINNNGARSK